MALILISSLSLVALAFLFGMALRFSDLLEAKRYRWFEGSVIAVGIGAVALALAMLAFSADALRTFWMAAVVCWLVGGQVRSLGRGGLVLGVLALLWFDGPSIHYDPWALGYFVAALLVGGELHRRANKDRPGMPRLVTFLFKRPHLFWYALAVGYCAIFIDFDVLFLLPIYAYVQGYNQLSPEEPAAMLRAIGVKRR